MLPTEHFIVTGITSGGHYKPFYKRAMFLIDQP